MTRLILFTAEAEGQVSHARLRELCDDHPRDLTLRLQDLVRRGLLVSSSEGRFTTYRATEGSEQSSEQSSQQTVPSGVATSRRRGYGSQAHQLQTIVALCQSDWRTLPELASALGRHESTVRTHYLKPLLDAGTLIRRHPDTPQHPHQAYRAAGSTP